ncbi:MAG TPA: anti-sigma factor [Egicoccus sp.]|nr:anti-sigma factor [Egicoccus sp.]HSK22882.1 anti-sigma factor [Egicoccus sp.]
MTSGCEERLGDLGAYVLDGLEPDEVADLERHLDDCAGCRAELAGLAPLPELLRLSATAPPPVPADLRPRTLAGLPRRRHLALPAAAALTLITALGAGAVVALDGDDTPHVVVLALPAQDDRPVQGEAGLHQVASGVRIDLELTGLRPADQGYYHAWLTRDGRRVSAGTFVGNPDGEAFARLQCGGDLDAYDELLVTWHGRDWGDEVVAVQRSIRG